MCAYGSLTYDLNNAISADLKTVLRGIQILTVAQKFSKKMN